MKTHTNPLPTIFFPLFLLFVCGGCNEFPMPKFISKRIVSEEVLHVIPIDIKDPSRQGFRTMVFLSPFGSDFAYTGHRNGQDILVFNGQQVATIPRNADVVNWEIQFTPQKFSAVLRDYSRKSYRTSFVVFVQGSLLGPYEDMALFRSSQVSSQFVQWDMGGNNYFFVAKKIGEKGKVLVANGIESPLENFLTPLNSNESRIPNVVEVQITNVFNRAMNSANELKYFYQPKFNQGTVTGVETDPLKRNDGPGVASILDANYVPWVSGPTKYYLMFNETKMGPYSLAFGTNGNPISSIRISKDGKHVACVLQRGASVPCKYRIMLDGVRLGIFPYNQVNGLHFEGNRLVGLALRGRKIIRFHKDI